MPEYALKLTYCRSVDQRANVMLLWDKGIVGVGSEWFLAELHVWEVHCKTGNYMYICTYIAEHALKLTYMYISVH